MKWSLLELRKHQEQPVIFDETFDLKVELMSSFAVTQVSEPQAPVYT